MDALILHIKLFTEGFRVAPGDAYVPVELPRGERGCYIVSDGSSVRTGGTCGRPRSPTSRASPRRRVAVSSPTTWPSCPVPTRWWATLTGDQPGDRPGPSRAPRPLMAKDQFHSWLATHHGLSTQLSKG